MQEIFYEETSKIINEKSEKIKYNLFFIISIISFVAGFLWFFISFFLYDITGASFIINILVIGLPIVVFILFGFICMKIKNSFCIQYDYTLVTGTITIDKVIKNVKRIHLYNFDFNQIEQIGKFASDTYFKLCENPNINRELLTDDDTSLELFYLVVNISGEKNILILQCSEKFIAYVLKFTGKTVLEKDFL